MTRVIAPARFAVGDHVCVIGEEPRLCGTVSSAFEAYGGSWAYGVMYDDHTPLERRPFGSPGHSYAQANLEPAEEVAYQFVTG